MAELDIRLRPYLCAALEAECGRRLGRVVRCVDVADSGLRWDYEIRGNDQGVIARITYTMAPWVEALKAVAELQDIQTTLERELEVRDARDIIVSLHFAELPKSRAQRQVYARRLVPFIMRGVAAILEHPDAYGFDLLRSLGHDCTPRAMELHTTLNHFEVGPCQHGGPALFLLADSRMWHFQPWAASVVLPRLEDKLVRHGADAAQLDLVVEVEDAVMSEAALEELRASIEPRHLGFKSFCVCTRNHSTTYAITRIY